MNPLLEEIQDYANHLSGRDDLLKNRQVHVNDPDYELQLRFMVRYIRPRAEINEKLVDQYEETIDLLRELKEDNKDQIEYKFKKMRRDRMKEKYRCL